MKLKRGITLSLITFLLVALLGAAFPPGVINQAEASSSLSIGDIVKTTANSTGSVSYNRQAAYDYAEKYWDKVCSDGYFWNKKYPPTYIGRGVKLSERQKKGVSYDCAHFVSAALEMNLMNKVAAWMFLIEQRHMVSQEQIS